MAHRFRHFALNRKGAVVSKGRLPLLLATIDSRIYPWFNTGD